MQSTFQRIRLGLGLLALCALEPALGAAPVTREAVETSAEETQLPASASTPLLLRPCDKCAPVSIRVTSNTRFLVGERSLTLQEMRDLAQRPEGLLMVISYDPSTREIDSITGWL